MSQGAIQVPTTGTVSGLQNNQDINALALAIATLLSGASAPTAAGLSAAGSSVSSLAGMPWHDLTANILKLRDQADANWLSLFSIDETNKVAVAAGVVGKNRIINGSFSVNQRSYASGTALSTGTYAHDRWKAGSGGCTYTFIQSQPDTTITITAGSLQQIIEGGNIEGPTFTLSWSGTAQARINGGSYGQSPIVATGLVVGANVTVEFDAGTLGKVQFESGALATSFERRSFTIERLLCRAYYQTGHIQFASFSNGTGQNVYQTMSFSPPMRAVPAIVETQFNAGAGASSVSYNPTQTDFAMILVSNTSMGPVFRDANWSANAEL